MFENGEFHTQLMLYQHGIWVLVADIVKKADYATDVYLQSQNPEQLDQIIILLNLAENLAKATSFLSDEADATYRAITETLEAMRTLALQRSGIGSVISVPEGWDVAEN